MTFEQLGLFGLFAAVFAFLLWGRFRYDLVAFSALMIGVVAGLVPSAATFEGFGHPATVIVALVLIVSRGLMASGAIDLITRAVIDQGRALGAHIAMIGGLGAVLSAFMNNVAALALLMPIDIQTAEKAGRSPRATLMPLSFATILGGLVTLIGTPPNIIVASYREEALGEPFAMFDFAPVGLVAAAAGLAFVALIGWRLIPRAAGDERPTETLADLGAYIAEIEVPEGAKLAGRRVYELEEAGDLGDVAIVAVIRARRRLWGVPRGVKIEVGDTLVVEARPEALETFRAAQGLAYDGAKRREMQAAGDGVELIELVVPEGAPVVGRSALGLQLLRRHGATLLGISRRGRRITERVRREGIEAGDVLLFLAPSEGVAEVTARLGALPLAPRGLAVTQTGKAGQAALIFAVAVAAASFGLVYLPVALGCVAIAYVLTGVVSLREIYDHVEWPVVVLLGSMIPLGTALEAAGGTALLAQSIVAATEGAAPWVVLLVLMAVTMTLSDVLNNTATTIIAVPIALDIAGRLGVSADPFLMGVAVAASCAFLTPIGHKNNTLILGPGGYAFGDYWRMGLPLELLVLAVSVPAILVFWPL
ncbi:MAG: SLC13 family permease [Pseudomonadota bacterium]